uniref:CSD domain-containing protein n=2 Tax=Lotharella oceanica TaxID=641309 RepID=A0A7S2TTA9_9EUKA|mmetsp:Transcript_27185/g.50751  ORF Transcript_27185/g.50751 Transcript_27185/m.50751 type:complete len:170 (+) Transcript_27185:99-608(+)
MIVIDSNDVALDAAKALGMSVRDVRNVFEFPSDIAGKVKWYDTAKGYGFIAPKAGGEDLFVHQSSIRALGFRFLERDERVQFTVSTGKNGKLVAKNVRAPHGKRLACSVKHEGEQAQRQRDSGWGVSSSSDDRKMTTAGSSLAIGGEGKRRPPPAESNPDASSSMDTST